MFDWHGVEPEDVLIERQVDELIASGYPVPRWGWPVPRTYGGATGSERITGWQKVRIAEVLGLLPPRGECSLCGDAAADHRHTEVYFRPLVSLGVCKRCHFAIHRRFGDPNRWNAYIDQRADVSGWARSLRTVELDRQQALIIAVAPDIFAALATI